MVVVPAAEPVTVGPLRVVGAVAPVVVVVVVVMLPATVVVVSRPLRCSHSGNPGSLTGVRKMMITTNPARQPRDMLSALPLC